MLTRRNVWKSGDLNVELIKTIKGIKGHKGFF